MTKKEIFLIFIFLSYIITTFITMIFEYYEYSINKDVKALFWWRGIDFMNCSSVSKLGENRY